MSELWEAGESGRLLEAFCCGTAAVVCPVGSIVRTSGAELTLTTTADLTELLSQRLKARIQAIQHGCERYHNWCAMCGE